MGIVQHLRDCVGPMIGMGKSTQTEGEEKARDPLIAYRNALSKAKDVTTSASSDVWAVIETAESVLAKNSHTAGVAEASASLLKDSLNIHTHKRLQPGDLTARHENPADAINDAKRRFNTAMDQIERNQKLEGISQRALESSNVDDRQALHKSGDSIFSDAASSISKAGKDCIGRMSAKLDELDLDGLREKALTAIKGRPGASEQYQELEDQHIRVDRQVAAMKEEIDGKVDSLYARHDGEKNDLMTCHRNKFGAREQIDGWKAEAQNIKHYLMKEFEQPLDATGAKAGAKHPKIANEKASSQKTI